MASSLTTLPPELYLTIFDHLPTRKIRTIISPLSTITREAPSIKHLLSLSQTNKHLRQASSPVLFEAISIKSLKQLEEFIYSGTLERVGGYVKRLVVRWEHSGEVILQETYFGAQEDGLKTLIELVEKLIVGVPGIRNLQMDFPGAVDALSATLVGDIEGQLGRDLKVVSLRNGRCVYSGDVGRLVVRLGKVDGLKSLVVDGNLSGEEEQRSLRRDVHGLGVTGGEFKNLVNLDVSGVKSMDDGLLRWIVGSAKRLTSLSVKGCSMVSLRGMRSLLVEYGSRLESLSLEILKCQQDCSTSTPFCSGPNSGYTEDEHLCPVIRTHCSRLQILELYTNLICKDIFFAPSAIIEASGAMTGGLPTPPGSAELAPVTATGIRQIPTPPIDGISLPSGQISPALLPPPLFDFFSSTKLESLVSEELYERKGPMKNVSLRIPYDVSCFGAGSRGPSLQQSFTNLCDGMPAKELLEIGKKAFEDGLVEVVKIRGHWKGGPYLIMAD